MATKKKTEDKDTNEIVVEEIQPKETKSTVVDEKDEQIKVLTAQIEAQKQALEEMMQKMSQMSATPNIQIVKDTYDINRKIKVVSCCPCFLNVTTEPRGGGVKYRFPRFGAVENIKMDNLEKCVHNNRTSFERGDLFICDADAVADLGLSEFYEKLYDVDTLNSIIHLKNGEVDIERICTMGVYDPYAHEYTDISARENVINAIIANMAKGVTYDRNLVYMLGQRLNINFDEKVAQAKEVFDKQNSVK